MTRSTGIKRRWLAILAAAPISSFLLVFLSALPSPMVIRVNSPRNDLRSVLASRAALPSRARRIIFRGGRYMLDAPLELTARDSGLTIESAPGERAVLCGGRQVTGWQREAGSPLGYAELRDFALKPWRFRMLVVNGPVAERAGLPQKGFFQDENPDFSVETQKATDEQLTTLRYRAGDLGSWLDLKSADLRVYRMWDESVSKIAWLEADPRVVRLVTPLRYPPSSLRRHSYLLVNVREGLQTPGQWFLDYGANRLYY